MWKTVDAFMGINRNLGTRSKYLLSILEIANDDYYLLKIRVTVN